MEILKSGTSESHRPRAFKGITEMNPDERRKLANEFQLWIRSNPEQFVYSSDDFYNMVTFLDIIGFVRKTESRLWWCTTCRKFSEVETDDTDVICKHCRLVIATFKEKEA